MSPDKRPAPPALPSLDQVPEELRSLRRWLAFRLEWDEAKEKWRKPPYSPVTGLAIGAVEKYAADWLPFEEALEGVKKFELSGVGFVFVEADGYVGIDFDNCRADGVIHPEVLNWLKWLPTYLEVSPSGTGIHAIAKGKIARALTSTELPGAGGARLEAYNQGRYFTFTGQRIGETLKIADCQTGIEKLLLYTRGKVDAAPAEIDRPMTALTAKKIHADNLETLRNAPHGAGNATLNTVAFFAARAVAVLEGGEAALKKQLFDIVTKEWTNPHDSSSARATIESGWNSGSSKPLSIIEDEFPEVSELLEDFNKKFYVVENFGGRCRVCWEDPNPAFSNGKSLLLGNQSFADFKNRFMHQRIPAGKKEDGSIKVEDKATVWLKHRYRRQYREVVFRPNEATSPTIRNLWNGFAFEPKKGDCSLYLTHVRENICHYNPATYEYLMGWMAYAVRHPNEPGYVAIVVQGLKGVGKNVFAETFSALWGQHGIIVSDQSRITRNFNAHLRDKCVLIADEAFFAGDRRHEGVLKSLITGPTITIEAKGIDAVTVPNLLRIIIIGNDPWLVPVSSEERRFLVLNCSDARRIQTKYFESILDQLRRGGYEALLYHLLYEVDLSKFNVREAPHTTELRGQMAESLRDADGAWFECLYTGLVPGKVNDDGLGEMSAADFIEWARDKQPKWSSIKPQHVGMLFGDNPQGRQKGMNFPRPKVLIDGKRLRYWRIPELKEARELWNKLRFEFAWPEDGETWESFETKKTKF